jgi:zinc protease
LLARARNPALERAERALRENGAWTGLVTRAQSDPSRLDRLLGLRARIAAITPAQLQAIAVKYLTPQQRLDVKIVAASAPTAPGVTTLAPTASPPRPAPSATP